MPGSESTLEKKRSFEEKESKKEGKDRKETRKRQKRKEITVDNRRITDCVKLGKTLKFFEAQSPHLKKCSNEVRNTKQ